MLVKTKYVRKPFLAFTVWPFIFILPGALQDTGLIEHELVHYKEQRKCLTIPWLLRYWLSKKFRLAAEVRAYRRQMEVGGITLGRAAYLLTQYGLGVSYVEALKLLKTKAS